MNQKRDVVKIVEKGLYKIKKDNLIGRDYLLIATLAMSLLDNQLEEGYEMPVNVEKIAKNIGIDVYYQALNRNGEEKHKHNLVGTIYKRPNIVTQEITSSIIIDAESRRAQQRFALAHELAHYLIHSDNKLLQSGYYIMPMLFFDVEEMIADIFATFLLIPIPQFFQTFFTYIKGQFEPVKTDDWLKYLSIVSEVPYEDVAIGYQNMRFVAAMLYQVKKEEGRLKEILDGLDEDVAELVTEQITKINNSITEEMEKELYCESLIISL